jgi:hypothetical protein
MTMLPGSESNVSTKATTPANPNALFGAINAIISVGSVDGVLTTAALIRQIKASAIWSCLPVEDPSVDFCQAFTVDKVRVREDVPCVYALVDLAVNNRDKKMTRDFVLRLQNAGHVIGAIVDEHDRADWVEALGRPVEGLLVEPQSQNGGPDAPKSSGEVLRRAFEKMGAFADTHTLELLAAADAADHMDFSTRFGGMVNQAVKSNIADDSRRVYMARHLSASEDVTVDEKIQGWIDEYPVLLANHQAIRDAATDLGAGILRASALEKKVDMTVLLKSFYDSGAKVVALEGEVYNKELGRKTVQISFGTNLKGDLLAAIKAVVPEASGFAQKANCPPEKEQEAIEAVRGWLTAQ